MRGCRVCCGHGSGSPAGAMNACAQCGRIGTPVHVRFGLGWPRSPETAGAVLSGRGCPRVGLGLGAPPVHFAVGAGGHCVPRSTVEATSLHLPWWGFGLLGSEGQVWSPSRPASPTPTLHPLPWGERLVDVEALSWRPSGHSSRLGLLGGHRDLGVGCGGSWEGCRGHAGAGGTSGTGSTEEGPVR